MSKSSYADKFQQRKMVVAQASTPTPKKSSPRPSKNSERSNGYQSNPNDGSSNGNVTKFIDLDAIGDVGGPIPNNSRNQPFSNGYSNSNNRGGYQEYDDDNNGDQNYHNSEGYGASYDNEDEKYFENGSELSDSYDYEDRRQQSRKYNSTPKSRDREQGKSFNASPNYSNTPDNRKIISNLKPKSTPSVVQPTSPIRNNKSTENESKSDNKNPKKFAPPPLPSDANKKPTPIQPPKNKNMLNDEETVNDEIERLEREIGLKLELENQYENDIDKDGYGVNSGNSNNNNTDKKKKITYKPYTLEQYKASQAKEYVEIIPKLRPDLNSDELIAKRANNQRIKEFAKQLHEYNKSSIPTDKKVSGPEAEAQEKKKKFDESQHVKRMEFAKQIPIPKPKSVTSSVKAATASIPMADKKSSSNTAGGVNNGGSGSGPMSSSSTSTSNNSNYSSGIPIPINRNKNTKLVNTIYEGDEHDDDYNDDDGDDAYASGNIKQTMNYQKPSKIEELENLHRESKMQIEAIKKSLRI